MKRFAAELGARRMGDPLARDTEVGPQARRDLRDELHRQVEESVKRGARLVLGGEIPPGRGAFYPPTVLDGGGARACRPSTRRPSGPWPR